MSRSHPTATGFFYGPRLFMPCTSDDLCEADRPDHLAFGWAGTSKRQPTACRGETTSRPSRRRSCGFPANVRPQTYHIGCGDSAV